MRRFVFSLAAVLRYKQQRERLAELAELAARAAAAAAQQRVAELERQLRRLAESSGMSTARLDLWSQSETALQRANADVTQAQRRLDEAVEKRRKAKIAVESLEILRRQQWDEHRRAAQREEQMRLDEISMQRWAASRGAARAGEQQP